MPCSNSALAKQAIMPSTWEKPDLRFASDWIASAPQEEIEGFLDSLSAEALAALPWLFEFWALDHQMPPEGDWRSWVVLGGRGAGKTRAGAEWVRSIVESDMPVDPGECGRIALVGETFDQARDVMVFGDSGILACTPPDRRPEWQSTRRRLIWPNGAIAEVFSASSPEALRGPQFDAAWVDELGKWRKARDAWDMLQFALRLGENPRQVVTTTPRNSRVLREILASGSTVTTTAPSEANRANLASSFLKEVRARYGGTRLARQELDGVLLSDVDGALWSGDMLKSARADDVPELDRIIVAVDPAVSSKSSSDATGIVVVGAEMKGPRNDWRVHVLEDATVQGASPNAWGKAVLRVFKKWNADRVVAETNQGGGLVESVLRQTAPELPYRAVHASKGKAARAEPVAALYEQGRVFHHGDLALLEEQMCEMTVRGFAGQNSPDRVDALVWGVTDLMNGFADVPRVRTL